jgi:hypothetical protein
MSSDTKRQHVQQRLAERRQRLMAARELSPAAAIARRYNAIDGSNQGVLISVQLFTVVIPLMILGFAFASGFAGDASPGTVWIRELGLEEPNSGHVRDAFGAAAGLRSTWNVLGLAAFLVWGIPMSMTVAAMFARAWQREQFDRGQRLVRGALWFVLYLTMMGLRVRIADGAEHTRATQIALFAVTLIPMWIFWSLTPLVLVRDGGRGLRYLALAGLAGVVIDGIIIPVVSRLVFPPVIGSWTDFGPIGVAMALMAWCGVLGVGWVIIACTGAVMWERTAPTDTVVEAQTAD